MKELCEQTLSNDGTRRISLFRRENGLYEVVLERKIPASPECGEPDRWAPVHPRVVLTDTLSRARAVAEEDLARTTRL